MRNTLPLRADAAVGEEFADAGELAFEFADVVGVAGGLVDEHGAVAQAADVFGELAHAADDAAMEKVKGDGAGHEADEDREEDEQVIAPADGADFIDAFGQQALLAGTERLQLLAGGVEERLIVQDLAAEIGESV